MDFLNGIAFSLFSLFILSSIQKMVHLRYFLEAVTAYHILPEPIARSAGVLIPLLELAGAVLLTSSKTVMYGAVILLLLLLSFLFAVVHVLKTKRNVLCGCYGRFLEAQVDGFTLIKIIFLLGFTVVVMLATHHHPIVYTPLSVSIGLFLTGLILLCQKIWTYHQQTVSMLRTQHRGVLR
jgi:hypothetical protein